MQSIKHLNNNQVQIIGTSSRRINCGSVHVNILMPDFTRILQLTRKSNISYVDSCSFDGGWSVAARPGAADRTHTAASTGHSGTVTAAGARDGAWCRGRRQVGLEFTIVIMISHTKETIVLVPHCIKLV